MTNTELARSYYRIFKGLTLLFFFIAAPVFIFSIVMLFSVFGSHSNDDVMAFFAPLGAFFALLLSGGFTLALALYFERYVKENEENEDE